MADTDLQALLDPDDNGRGIRILRRTDETSETNHSYYVDGGVTYGGRVRWVDVAAEDSDEDKNTAIRAALA